MTLQAILLAAVVFQRCRSPNLYTARCQGLIIVSFRQWSTARLTVDHNAARAENEESEPACHDAPFLIRWMLPQVYISFIEGSLKFKLLAHPVEEFCGGVDCSLIASARMYFPDEFPGLIGPVLHKEISSAHPARKVPMNLPT